MFCTQCGGSLTARSKFCNHCGAPVASELAVETPAAELAAGASEVAASIAVDSPGTLYGEMASNRTAVQVYKGESAQPTGKKRAAIRSWMYLLPVSCLLLVSITAAGDYLYQHHLMKQTEALLQSSEKLALDGKYAEAQEQTGQALELRPSHAVLLNNQAVLADVMKLDGSIQAADKEAKSKHYDKAIKNIHALQNSIAARDGAIYKKLGTQAGTKEEAFVVGQVKDSISAKKTVNDLLPLLDVLKPYGGADAKIAVKNVKQKIVDLSYERSTVALQSQNFEKALTIVADALKQDDQNEKLLGLQKTIKVKQKAFEEAEQQRIQKAIEASTKEDMNNRTNGVQLFPLMRASMITATSRLAEKSKM